MRTIDNLIGKPLTDGRLKYRSCQQPSARTLPSQVPTKPIVRITGHDGSIIHKKWDGKEGSKIRVRQQSCFICRRYTCKTTNTQWKCRECGMPLCQVDRSDSTRWRPYTYTCIQEHLSSQDEYIGCNKMKHNSFILPDHLKKHSMTRLQEQLRKEDRQRKRRE